MKNAAIALTVALAVCAPGQGRDNRHASLRGRHPHHAAQRPLRAETMHIMKIDLTAPGIHFEMTPQTTSGGSTRNTDRQTTVNYLNQERRKWRSTPISSCRFRRATRRQRRGARGVERQRLLGLRVQPVPGEAGYPTRATRSCRMPRPQHRRRQQGQHRPPRSSLRRQQARAGTGHAVQRHLRPPRS